MMLAKTFILVLFGTALVLANPIPENQEDTAVALVEAEENDVSDFDENEIFASTAELPDLFPQDNYSVRRSDGKSSLSKKWDSVKQKWEVWLQKGRNKWEHIKDTSKEKYEKILAKWNIVREEGLKLIEQAKTTFETIKKNGEESYAELKEVYAVVKDAWNDLKATGTEAYTDIKELLDELKKSLDQIGSKIGVLSKIG